MPRRGNDRVGIDTGKVDSCDIVALTSKCCASQAVFFAPPENPPNASRALPADGHCSSSTASAAVFSASRRLTLSLSAATASVGSTATDVHPGFECRIGIGGRRRRLELYPGSEVALMTITGQSCAISKFAGDAMVIGACSIGSIARVPPPGEAPAAVRH